MRRTYLLATSLDIDPLPGCGLLYVDKLTDNAATYAIAEHSDADYALLYTKRTTFELGMFAPERMIHIAKGPGTSTVYADHYQVTEDKQSSAPVINYQLRSLRGDFDFGSVLLFKASVLREAVRKIKASYDFAGLYDLRLKLSQKHPPVHINECLYSEIGSDTREGDERILNYVDPKNRGRQIEMEATCIEHLKEIGGYLKPKFEKIEFSADNFEYEASMIIPVRNRIRTVRDTIRSVLSQKTEFKFNLIVTNNHSTDDTTGAIDKYKEDSRLIHLIPERSDLGISGCWNLGVCYPLYGESAVQLNNDDIYAHERALQLMISAFYEQNCTMVVSTYMMADFDMNMISPDVIDHRKWTPRNGRSNALRINSLGTPRAFCTPILHEVRVPNTNYGEDYALGLNLSHRYQIGHIYEVVYFCRRWDGSSSALPGIVKMNGHNLYKDHIRIWELQAQIALNKKQK